MDELAKLVREVRFRERLRGYDYDEVDAYVSSVSEVAAKAKICMAELRQRAEKAEAQLVASQQYEIKYPEMRDELAGALILAQRAANQAKAEAKAEAAKLLELARQKAEKVATDVEAAVSLQLQKAEERAALIVAEAESHAERIISDASRHVSEKVEADRINAMAEIHVLEKTKTDLTSDIIALKSQRNDQLQQLSSLWRSLCSFANEVGLDRDLDDFDRASVPIVGSVSESTDTDTETAVGRLSTATAVVQAHESPPVIDPASGVSVSEFVVEPPVKDILDGEAVSSEDNRDAAKMSTAMPMPNWRDDLTDSQPQQGVNSSPYGPPSKSSDGDSNSNSKGINSAAESMVATESMVNENSHLDDVPKPATTAEPLTVSDSESYNTQSMVIAGTAPLSVFTAESAQQGEFVEQLRRVVNGDELSQGDHYDPMAAFFDEDEPVRNRWKRPHR